MPDLISRIICIMLAVAVGIIIIFEKKSHSLELFITYLSGISCAFIVPFNYKLTESVFLIRIYNYNNPDLYLNDYIINSSHGLSGYNTFSYLLSIPPETILPQCTYVIWLVIAGSFSVINYLIAKNWFCSRHPCIVAVVVTGVICLCYHYGELYGFGSLGDNAWIYPFLRHQSVAMLMIPLSFYAWFTSRPIMCGIITGIAFYFHFNVGLYLILLISIDSIFISNVIRKVVLYYVATLIVSALVLINVMQNEYGALAHTSPPHVFINVSGYLRHPHHMIYSAFPLKAYLSFIIINAMYIFLALYCTANPIYKRILRIIISICAFQFVGWIFVEVFPIDYVGKLQLSRMTLIGQWLSIIGIIVFCVDKLPRAIESVRVSKIIISCAILLIFIAGTLANRHDISLPIASPLESWFVSNSDPNSLVLISPLEIKFHQFEAITRRSTVVNFKRLPFEGDQVFEYITRILRVLDMHVDINKNSMEDMRRNKYKYNLLFNRMTAEQLTNLLKNYSYNYVIRDTKYDANNLPFPLVYEDEYFKVYSTVPY